MHNLSSGSVEKSSLTVTNTPDNDTILYFHANIELVGLAICKLNQEADILTILKSTQLLMTTDTAMSIYVYTCLYMA